MEKIKINIELIMPDVPDERDACVQRLISELESRHGIEKVHIIPETSNSKAQLCFHYNPDIIRVDQVQNLAEQAGAKITHQFHHLLIEVQGIRHPRHARIIEIDLKSRKGILSASASASGVMMIEFDTTLIKEADVYKAIKKLGLRIPEQTPEQHVKEHEQGHEHDHGHDHKHRHEEGETGQHDHGGIFGKNTELIFSILCGAFLGIGFGLSFVKAISNFIPIAFYVAAYFLGGFFTVKEAIEAIRNGWFEIDFLMIVAAIGAAILGDWAEGALLLFLFSLGHALEHYAMGKAQKSIAALTELAPKTALLKTNGQTKEIKIDDLRKGDTVVVKPNTKIPADGIVIHGSGNVNQAPITGESIPVDKVAVENPELNLDQAAKLNEKFRVFAGTINGNELLEIRVMKEAKDSTLSRLIKMVNEAQTQKSPTQHLTDKFEKYFVPVVLILVTMLCFVFLIIDEPFSKSFYRAMTVLVAASPCALAISTPSAVLSGIARAAKSGVLIKGGRPLEDLGSLSAIAFDKTGTLTEGKPKLTQVLPQGGITENELLKIVVAVEQLSDHPLARSIVVGAKERLKNEDVPQARDIEAVLGKGVKALLGNDKIFIGNLALFETLDESKPDGQLVNDVRKLEEGGNTTMVVRRNNDYIGIVAVMDTPRKEAQEALVSLKKAGITKMVMLTGDNQKVADAVAKQIGIEEALGSLLPEQKVEAIEKLTTKEHKAAMVGDGVNDAPAMAKSTVGIAMGAAGSDVALETADIALMGDKLLLLPFAIGLSRKAKKIIKQNLIISLGMVALLIPLTILGVAQIGPAVVAHEGSTLLVVFNALRLLGYSSKP